MDRKAIETLKRITAEDAEFSRRMITFLSVLGIPPENMEVLIEVSNTWKRAVEAANAEFDRLRAENESMKADIENIKHTMKTLGEVPQGENVGGYGYRMSFGGPEE